MKLAPNTPFYKEWLTLIEQDIKQIINAIENKDFKKFGNIIENNSESMHKVINQSNINYSNADTIKLKQKIISCRNKYSIPVYYTQDAGSNLIIFFEDKDLEKIKSIFTNINIIKTFN